MGRNRGSHGKIIIPDTDSGATDQTGYLLYRLLQTVGRPFEFSLNEQTETGNTSKFEASPVAYVENNAGQNSATLGFRMLFPKDTPAWGHRGLVTAASHYTTHLHAWQMAINWEVLPATEFVTTPIDNKQFEPGDYSWSGSMTGVVSDTTSLIESGVEAAASFRLNEESGTDNTLAGTIITNSRAVTVNRQGGHQVIQQGFIGDGVLTGAGDNALISGALGLPEITECVLTYNTGKTETIDLFVSALNVNVQRGQQIQIDGTLQITGVHSLS